MRLVHLFLLVAVSALSLWLYAPPPSVPASASPEVFSAERAMAHLRKIADAPHPVGSANHQVVRQYLVDSLTGLGLQPEVQRVSQVNAWRGRSMGAMLHNVIARIPGSRGGRAVLVMAHYDSVPTSHGASDDGAAVATVLETLRALQTGPPLANDVIVLFSDGEELGLLGARAFEARHPLARSVEVVLNFDARGTRGPVMMFETSGSDGTLIHHLARTEHPIGNSLAGEIYKLMPGDTDFTVFREAGRRGLNFAFIDWQQGYHTRLDRAVELDPDSLQHQGSYLLSLLRTLGQADLTAPPVSERIYFNALGAVFIVYPSSWAVPLGGLASACCLAVLVLAWRRGRVRPVRVALGLLVFVGFVALLTGVASLLWTGLVWIDETLRALPPNHLYHHRLIFAGFTGLALAFATGGGAVARRWLSVLEMALGAQLVWAVLAVVSALVMPGASYLFTWPLLASVGGVWACCVAPAEVGPTHRSSWALTLSAVPTLLLFSPTLYGIFVALAVGQTAVLMSGVGLVLGLLIAPLALVAGQRAGVLMAGATLVGVSLLAVAWGGAGYDGAHPRLNTLSLVVDADKGKAAWVSFDSKLDVWTRAFLEGGTRDEQWLALLPGRPPVPLAREVRVVPEPGPSLEVIDDSLQQGERRVNVRLRGSDDVVRLTLRVESPSEMLGIELEGHALEAERLAKSRNSVDYWAPPESLEVRLRLRAGEPLRVRVIEQTFGLPLSQGQKRPAHVMPSPDPAYGLTDSIFVSRAFSL